MDLLYRYEVFSREVLTLARAHPLLRYAACAVAAKQLAQMASPLQSIPWSHAQRRLAERLSKGPFDFEWYSVKYYDQAIQTLVRSITSTQPDHATTVSLAGGDLVVQAKGEDPIVRLLGTCILIQYEHLQANRDAWSGHLKGFWMLLELTDDGNLLHPNTMYKQVYPFTKGIMQVKAAFWNFVVNDMEEACAFNTLRPMCLLEIG